MFPLKNLARKGLSKSKVQFWVHQQLVNQAPWHSTFISDNWPKTGLC